MTISTRFYRYKDENFTEIRLSKRSLDSMQQAVQELNYLNRAGCSLQPWLGVFEEFVHTLESCNGKVIVSSNGVIEEPDEVQMLMTPITEDKDV